MKNVIFILFLTCSMGVIAQSWKDSLQKGNEYYQDKNYQQAYETLLEAQKLAPEDVDLSKDIGNAAYRTNDFQTAEKAFQSAATSGENTTKQAQQWHNVGNSQMQAKNYSAAVESYKNALRLNPSNDKTRYNLAEAKRRLKQQEDQQNQQNDQDQNNQQDKKQDDNQSQNQNQNNDNNQDNNQQNNNEQQNNNQPNGGNDNQSNPENSGRLSDRKTDRMLEELMKQEIDTKKKMQSRGSENGENSVKSGKRW